MDIRRDVFQAIADPTRREIIHLVANNKSLNLNAIAGHFEISRSAISQQIKILVECGLIGIRRQGRERFCEAQLHPLNEVSAWVEQYRKLREERYVALDNLLDRMKKKAKKRRK
jgi:DNA-binding transcriptional ArsR family regulator